MKLKSISIVALLLAGVITVISVVSGMVATQNQLRSSISVDLTLYLVHRSACQLRVLRRHRLRLNTHARTKKNPPKPVLVASAFTGGGFLHKGVRKCYNKAYPAVLPRQRRKK